VIGSRKSSAEPNPITATPRDSSYTSTRSIPRTVLCSALHTTQLNVSLFKGWARLLPPRTLPTHRHPQAVRWTTRHSQNIHNRLPLSLHPAQWITLRYKIAYNPRLLLPAVPLTTRHCQNLHRVAPPSARCSRKHSIQGTTSRPSRRSEQPRRPSTFPLSALHLRYPATLREIGSTHPRNSSTTHSSGRDGKLQKTRSIPWCRSTTF